VASWWETEAAKRLLPELFGDHEGDHATPGEISVVLASYPELVATRAPAGLGAPSVHFYTATDFRQRFPDGRMGSDPSLASPANGEPIRAEVVADLAAAYREFLAES
jgi:creatinine amidohydrolase